MADGRRRGGLTGWIVGLIVILALGWTGYWFGARYLAEIVVERATTAPVAGNHLACAGRSFSGFPLRINLDCGTVTLAASGRSLDAALGGLSASAPLYRPGFVAATITSPLTINAPVDGLALTVSWSLGKSEATAGLGGLKSVSGSFLALELENAGIGSPLPIATARATVAEAFAKPAGGGAYAFGARADRLQIVRRNGNVLPEADIELSVRALDFGNSLGTDPLPTLLAWLRAGGTVEVERAKIRTGGAVVDADGTLTISADGVLSGSLALRVANIDALAALIEQLRPGSSDQVGPALVALTAMTVPVETEDGPARQTTLTIIDGLVAVGIIPIVVLPAIRL